ncbi:arginine N-succinyltransferase [Criblamydia sequanensis]|uniref:Arginine N-succinyltransferase n=1 Tax=Candidatus Criblamydia sequanensis CRIB-18 TaxID=1437425 RepID=A0A090D1H9_9BACT|nr:arginine N-succinyltransferase [Criblamydia sequanensis]CDR33835.1 Arginine N-succinyltransferase [Criblamydia sequanensis CRIB-18]
MFILRSLVANDHSSLFELAMKAHSGVTSLPKDRNLLKKKAISSEKSFLNPFEKNKEHIFLFILEDLEEKKPVGVSGIYTKSGKSRFPFLYRLEKIFPSSDPLLKAPSYSLLKAFKYEEEVTEIGSLFLEKTSRKEGLGKLLSLGRFLYMADNLEKFDKKTVASLRGIFTEQDECPFFDGITKKLIGLSYEEAVSLVYTRREYLEKILSPYPIIVDLLPELIQKSTLGIHPNTIPAKIMLTKQGFDLNNLLDPLDGGPFIEAKTSQIDVLKSSFLTKATSSPESKASLGLISKQNPFKALIAEYSIDGQKASLEEKVMKALEITHDDIIRVYPLKKK